MAGFSSESGAQVNVCGQAADERENEAIADKSEEMFEKNFHEAASPHMPREFPAVY